MMNVKDLIEKLNTQKSLTLEEYFFILDNYTEKDAEFAKKLAVQIRKSVYGNAIYIRGLIEVSNYCKNGCLYCGINRDNKSCTRYRLSMEEILSCCENGYKLGFRTFVMQGGEDNHFTDEFVCNVVKEIKARFPDCAVTLSLGERSYDSYKALYDAGADRYLLRHETADSEHYSMLHPSDLSLKTRIECLENLKSIGFQTGCGIMVGSPYQTNEHLAKDLKFIEEFDPQMCGIGPFLPHKDTVFADKEKGSFELTLFLLSLIRIMKPSILLPSTTALGTLREGGREMGIMAGANVIMPNLSPDTAKDKYMLYDNKLRTGLESVEGLEKLKQKFASIGYEIVTDRGDYKKQ
ncbi:MAG: [Clostridia bacterium]|nr:[FeFe] hydrogenase H-cluster radical SAM maturase HydE [Clostridia bacterium]